jgi:hypothetical protein
MTALTMLGFAKPAVEKLLMGGDWKNADGSPMTVEEIIKEGLKRLFWTQNRTKPFEIVG